MMKLAPVTPISAFTYFPLKIFLATSVNCSGVSFGSVPVLLKEFATSFFAYVHGRCWQYDKEVHHPAADISSQVCFNAFRSCFFSRAAFRWISSVTMFCFFTRVLQFFSSIFSILQWPECISTAQITLSPRLLEIHFKFLQLLIE